MRSRLIAIIIISLLRIYALFLYKDTFRKEEVNRILVYAYTGLGNFIMFTPALKKLREAFPEAHIVLQAGNDWGAEEAVRGSGIIDEVVWFRPSSGWLKLLKWLRKIRKEGYDLIISSFDSSFPIQTCLSGARYRVGHISGDGYHNPFDFVYNIKVPVAAGRHEIDLKSDLLAALGEEVNDKTLFFFIDEASQRSAELLLEKHGLSGKDYICLQPGAANMLLTAKRWDIEKFVTLVNRITDEMGIDIVLLGDKNEMVIGEFFLGGVAQGQKIHPLFGETTVKEVAAIIQNSKLLLCNDSGLMHVAVAVGTPLVAIYGPTDYRRTAPRSEKATIIRQDMPCSPCIQFGGEKKARECKHWNCMNGISVEEVLAAVSVKLNGVKRGSQ